MKKFSALTLTLALALTACGEEKQSMPVSFVDGTPVDIEELIDGRPAVLNFWAASCVFCKEELPLFQYVANSHPELAVIGINLQESADVVKAYWDGGRYTFDTLLDPEEKLKRQYSVATRPVTIVLGPDGFEHKRFSGPVTKEQLLQALATLPGVRDARPVQSSSSSSAAYSSEASDGVRVSPATSELYSWYQGEVRHSIPLSEVLSGGPPRDGIPSIDNPTFLLTREVEYLEDDDLGILVSVHGNTRFYPYKILVWHEIVNDTVGGEPIAVTYCPLCATGVVYSRVYSEGETEFGVSGLLYQSNLLMYDRETESLWSQVTGTAVVGPKTGEELYRMPSDIVTYSAAKEASYDLLVLSTETGYTRQYGRDPYEGYEQTEDTIFPTKADDREELHSKELVYGIVVDGMAKAFSLSAIKRDSPIQGYIGEGAKKIPLQIVYDEKTQKISFTRYYKDTPGKKEEIVALPAFWFSWVAQYPETELYQ